MARRSAYLFAHDLLDESTETVLDRLADAHLDGAVLAGAYHHSRDVFPHNPRHKVMYLEGGTVYFHPRSAAYAGQRLQPRVAAVAREVDPLGLLCEAGQRRGIGVSAWLVMLHNSRLAFEAPECAPVTAFGDPLLNGLCPANPAVRAYAETLAADVARYGLESIKLEALSYLPFEHGYHHERSFVPLSPNVRFLLGLCFCPHCVAHAEAAGIDAERVRRRVIDLVAPVFDAAEHETHEPDVEETRLRAECQGQLGRFLDARCEVVTSLAERVSAAVHAVWPATRVSLLDLAGATLGYATGRPSSDRSAASIAWRDGIRPAEIARACDALGVLGYFAEPARLEQEVRAYQECLPADRPLEVLLRPMAPDSRSAAELAAKLRVLERLGVEDVAFYHYGFMRLEALAWIASAIQSEPA